MKTYGFMLITEGRSLFVRTYEEIAWAELDENYTIKQLVAADEIQPVVIDSQKEFEDYKEMADKLYSLQNEQISYTKEMLEEAIELIEGIGELSAKKTENVIEMRGLLALIAQDCKKFLASE